MYVHLDINTLLSVSQAKTEKNYTSISVKHLQALDTLSFWTLTKPRCWAVKERRQDLFLDTELELNMYAYIPPDSVYNERKQRLFFSVKTNEK